MVVITRSRAAAQRGPNTTHPNANQNGVSTDVLDTAVQGAASSRKPARGRRARTNGAHKPANIKDAGIPASSGSRTDSKVVSQGEGSYDRHESQPRTATQTTSQTCGMYFEFTFQEVTTNAASSSSQQLPVSPPEANGAVAKKSRKGRRSTTRRGPNASAKTGRASQPTAGTSSTVRTGTKRRRGEDDGRQPVDPRDEMNSASAIRILRRVRRKTENTPATDAPNHDAVDEAVNRTRRNKGKARGVDVPTTEDTSVGSKRRRNGEDVYTDNVSQLPLGPGPSRRTTRRTRQKVEVPMIEETKKRTVRKPKGRRSTACARPCRTTSTPGARESEEQTFAPPLAPSTETLDAEEQPVPQGVQSQVVVKQEVTPSLSPSQQTMQLPAENAVRKRVPSVLLGPLMIPGPFVLRPADWSSTDVSSRTRGSIIKAEETSSSDPVRDVSSSPEPSDKKNEPIDLQLAQRRWSAQPDDISPLSLDPPGAPDDDGYFPEPSEAGSDEENSTPEDEDDYPFYSVVRRYPRPPFEPMEITFSRASQSQESGESEAAPSEDGGHTDPENVVSRPSVPDVEVSPKAVRRETSASPRDGDSASNKNTVSSPRRVEELTETPLSLGSTVLLDDPDQGTLSEHGSPVSLVAEPTTKPKSPPSIASEGGIGNRSKCRDEDAFDRSNAPPPSPSLLDRFLASFPERDLSLPLCQCGNPERHFVVHSDGEASDFSFMGDDEDF